MATSRANPTNSVSVARWAAVAATDMASASAGSSRVGSATPIRRARGNGDEYSWATSSSASAPASRRPSNRTIERCLPSRISESTGRSSRCRAAASSATCNGPSTDSATTATYHPPGANPSSPVARRNAAWVSARNAGGREVSSASMSSRNTSRRC